MDFYFFAKILLPKKSKSYLVYPNSEETGYNGSRKSFFHLLVSQLWRPFLALISFACEGSLCYYSVLQHSLQIFLEYPHYAEYSTKPWRCSKHLLLETYVLTGGVYQLTSKPITENSVVLNNNHAMRLQVNW